MAFLNHKLPDKALTPDEALAKIEHFCAYRERCPQEVQRKIATFGLQPEIAEQIYSLLEGEGYVNETRFAEAYAGGKFRVNRWGRVRIRLELQRRDISPAIIEAALASINTTEYTRVLKDLLKKKRQQYRHEPDFQQRNKAAAALIRAGFEPELVFQHL